MKNIFISLINFNGRVNTLACLDSIKKIKTNGFKLTVLVIDNKSNEELDLKEAYLSDIPLKIILNKDNLGFAEGHNVGIRYALRNGADYIVILNNDIIVDEDLINELFKVIEKDTKIGIVVPKIYFAKGNEYHKNKYKNEDLGRVIWYAGGEMDWGNIIGKHRGVDEVDKGQYERIYETGFASGACMLVRKEVFEKVGLFDEKYFLYYEDADFSQRAVKKGYKIVYIPDAILWHKNAGSVGGSGSELQDYYISRNRLLFGFKFASYRSKLALLKESVINLLKGRKWQKKGIWDFYLRRFGKGSYETTND